MKHIFLDTNVLAHFIPIEDIDWSKHLKDSEIGFYISELVIDELNDLKDKIGKNTPGNRAGEVLSWIEKNSDDNCQIQLRNGNLVHLCDDSAVSAENIYGLTQRRSDDIIINTILDFQIKTNPNDVYFITDDASLRLRIKHKKIPINTLIPDKNDKLSAFENPLIKEITGLKEELNKVRSAKPLLKLTFENDTNQINLSFSKRIFNPDDIRHRIRDEYKELSEIQDDKTIGAEDTMAILQHRTYLSMVDPDDIQHFNSQLKLFFNEHDRYLTQYCKYLSWLEGTIEISIYLTNIGGSPGEDIDIYMHFPDGFLLCSDFDLPRAPKEPLPPKRPMTPLQKASEDFRQASQAISLYSQGISRMKSDYMNATLVDLRKTKSYEVEFHVDELKHTKSEKLPTLYLHYDNPQQSKPFHIVYSILAGNYPTPFTGTLIVDTTRTVSVADID